MEYLQICVFIVLLAGFSPLVRGQCDGSALEVTGSDGEIKSPNFDTGGEYGEAANCSWEFNPSANGKEYALVLTVKQLKLYVVKSAARHCLDSYNLTINHDQKKCDRYTHGISDGGNIPANHFCNAYYSSPTCANVKQIQECEIPQLTPYPVSLSYFSDGRKDPGLASASMNFKIAHTFIECPEAETTPITTEMTSEAIAANMATELPTTKLITTIEVETIERPSTTKHQSSAKQLVTATPGKPEETTSTATTTKTSVNTAAATKQTDVATPTSNEGPGKQTDMIIIIAAAAGGGGLIAIVSIVLIIVMCKRKRKVSITEPKNNVEMAMEEVNHSNDGGATENGARASQHGGPTIPAAELYATISEPGKAPQQAIATGSTEPGSESTQPIAELYATVSKPPRLTEAKSLRPQDEPVTAPNQPESCLYATVSKPPRVTEQPQSSQSQDEHVTAPEQPEACLYAAVSIRKKGV